jgi:hypothetical protein
MGFERDRGSRVFVAGTLALLALLAFGAWGAAGGSRHAPAKHSTRSSAAAAGHGVEAGGQQSGPQGETRLIQVVSGATVKRFDLAEPAGVIRLLRVTVPHGTRANLTGSIPRVAGVGISTPHSAIPSEVCHRLGAVDVCTQAEQACPMLAATWQFRLHQLAGPAGEVRLEFVVG